MNESFNKTIPLQSLEDPKDKEIARLCKLVIDLKNQLKMAEEIADDATSIAESLRLDNQIQKEAFDAVIYQQAHEMQNDFETKRHLQRLVIKLTHKLLELQLQIINMTVTEEPDHDGSI